MKVTLISMRKTWVDITQFISELLDTWLSENRKLERGKGKLAAFLI